MGVIEMGLRFRKTISILPGVRLNLGKTTSSISVGVPGFRKTFNTKGQVTTTVGVPGTGLYYVDTKNPGKKAAARRKAAEENTARKTRTVREAAPAEQPAIAAPAAERPRMADFSPEQYRRPVQMTRNAAPQQQPEENTFVPAQVSPESLKSIHKAADDSIDWNEILALPEPPDPSYNEDMWNYYHSVAGAILEGDIDAYLKVIYEVNPLDDLLDYGSEFCFGTDDAAKMEVEFRVNESALFSIKASASQREYLNILQDFVCSTAIRIARDIFALLPVEHAVVHADMGEATILSVSFDRTTMDKIRFGMIDPSDTMARFPSNMDFNLAYGFSPVKRLGE